MVCIVPFRPSSCFINLRFCHIYYGVRHENLKKLFYLMPTKKQKFYIVILKKRCIGADLEAGALAVFAAAWPTDQQFSD